MRLRKPSRLGGAAKAAAAVFPENYFPVRTEYRVESVRIPAAFDGFRLVHLSDLHGCASRRYTLRLTEMISAAKPDAVVMTGDMADRQDKGCEGLCHFCRGLCGRYPVFYVAGNHEQELTGLRRKNFFQDLRGQGVQVLGHVPAELLRGGEKICLYGLNIPLKYYKHHRAPELRADQIRAVLGPRRSNAFTVLLAHNPFFFEAYAEWGADLTLSGHVHGGMIRLPHFGGLLSPERRFFPRYSGGMYASPQGTKMIVSRGLGKGARIGNRPEIDVVTLCASPAVSEERRQ